MVVCLCPSLRVTKRPHVANTLSIGEHAIQGLTHYPQANTLSNHRRVGHMASAPEGQSQDARRVKGLQPEVGARRVQRLLV